MKTKYIGSIIAFIIGILMWGISKTDSYRDIESNILFVILLFIVLVAIGGFLSEFLENMGSKKLGTEDF